MGDTMDTVLQPGDDAPLTGTYEELKIFGTPTGRLHVGARR